jgi:predicted DNA-binding protein (MmcQ/YjbR family)
VKAEALEREMLLDHGEPYYFPPYVGTKGWIGVRLDRRRPAWEEVAELIATSYCLIAPKRLAEQVKDPPAP